MASRKIKQFRYYNETDPKNAPQLGSDTTTLLDQYKDGTVFSGVFPISQLGIQGLPGTKFYLNGSVHPIIIGASGIYDLDIKNGARITDLGFDGESLKRIKDNPNAYLIVDVLYGEEDVE